ncbi:MAG: hypothetical protein RLZZ293_1525 [Pseudomonadota bacterium]
MTILNLQNELVVLECSGEDSANYLQGQLTNDIKSLAIAKYFQIAAHLNNKGRCLANFIILRPSEQIYYLITSKDLAEKIVARLKMFILRSKVSLQICQKFIYLSKKPINHDSYLFQGSYFLTVSDDNCDNNAEINANLWHNFLVEQQLPLIYMSTQEQIIPQQINLDLMDAINFKKGCYTGQEIVARTHYLGKVKRRLIKFVSQMEPVIGETLVSPIMDNQEIGLIVDFYYENNQYIGLASLQLDCLENVYLSSDQQQLNRLNCISLTLV